MDVITLKSNHVSIRDTGYTWKLLLWLCGRLFIQPANKTWNFCISLIHNNRRTPFLAFVRLDLSTAFVTGEDCSCFTLKNMLLAYLVARWPGLHHTCRIALQKYQQWIFAHSETQVWCIARVSIGHNFIYNISTSPEENANAVYRNNNNEQTRMNIWFILDIFFQQIGVHEASLYVLLVLEILYSSTKLTFVLMLSACCFISYVWLCLICVSFKITHMNIGFVCVFTLSLRCYRARGEL